VRRVLVRLALVAAAVLALDQWTKHLASEHLAYRPPVRVIGEFAQLTYTRNSGVAFGLGAGTGFPYYVFSIIAAVAILWLLLRGHVRDAPRQWALSLVFGGALGNLVDRLSTGEVVDFILIGWRGWHWPVFNVADSAVTVGVVLFALAASRRAPGDAERDEDSALAAAAGAAEPPPPAAERADEPATDAPGPAGRRG
jgi:signal peptidase II